MNPYREPAPQPIEVKHKPRGWWKTFQYKFLIWWKGTWRERYGRCEFCKKFVWKFERGPRINPTPFFHQMHCSKAPYAEQEKARDAYYFAIAPEPDEDFLGPLR